MREGNELWEAIAAAYDKHQYDPRVSPVVLANEGMRRILFPRRLHEVGWIGCNLQLRQIARQYCRKKFDPTTRDDDDDLFPETLQERYPTRPESGEDSEYVLLNVLSDDDVDYNIDRMEKSIAGQQKHLDALRAWKAARRRAA